jgi:hypothetical protein
MAEVKPVVQPDADAVDSQADGFRNAGNDVEQIGVAEIDVKIFKLHPATGQKSRQSQNGYPDG